MSPSDIKKHRTILPLELSSIGVFSSFDQILGRTQTEYSVLDRKYRWVVWLNLAKESAPDSYSLWNDKDMVEETCLGCIFLNKDNWCDGMGLPALFNPVTQSPGMACMGVGYQNQTELNLEK